MALVDVSVVEQRYRAVLAVQVGATVTEVAARFGVSRQSVHTWLSRYRGSGLAGLADRSHRPESCAHHCPVEVEAVVCELRRDHPRWGARRLVHELARTGALSPVPTRITVHRILVRHGLVDPQARRRKRSDYRRWQREAAMALWQLDIVGGVVLADGTEAKIVTGVDDCSRFCVIASVVARATGRAVCLAFAAALARYGVPQEVLTDNGKQFTDRFGKGGKVLFDRICRDNGIAHRLTQPASPTTTGKIERFHQTLRRELLDDHEPVTDLLAAQAAVESWVAGYNCDRPHQALDMAYLAERFAAGAYQRQNAEQLLPLRLPAALRTDLDTVTPPDTEPDSDPEQAPQTADEGPVAVAAPVYSGGPVEFDRIVPASGNLAVRGKQFWLGPVRAPG